MRKKIIRWSVRLVVLGFVFAVLLIMLVLNPQILYSSHTETGKFIIYHEQPLHGEFPERLAAAERMIKNSSLFDHDHKIKVCLNDGSFYPRLIEIIRGRAFGWGMYRIAVFRGAFDYENNTVRIGRYEWNMEQLLAHEFTHCQQINHFGLLDSNPIASHPTWKWEGYAEYVSRQAPFQNDLKSAMHLYKDYIQDHPDAWEIAFPDGTIAPRSYYEYWLLVKYSLDIEGVDYLSLMKDESVREKKWSDMERWYEEEQQKVGNAY